MIIFMSFKLIWQVILIDVVYKCPIKTANTIPKIN